jgi:peroxiredoxin
MHSLLALLFLGFFSVMSSSNESTQPETPLAMIGQAAPVFTLTEVTGKPIDLAQYKGKIVVLEWVNPFCPYSKGQYITGNMQSLQKRYTEQSVIWLTVNSTNATHPNARTNEEFVVVYKDLNSSATANLRDADGVVGKMYNARTTPHIFVVDKNGVLAYMGAIDDDRSTEGGANATVNYVAQAIDELEAGKSVSIPETKSYGCSVKY